MIRFRSPWLSHLPQIEVKGRLARQSVRLICLGIVGFLLLALLFLIWQPTIRSGPVYLLYWLHDRLFLPFKAYTYTIFFPGSIIWWGIATTVFALWLTSFLSDRSLILQPHIWLLRFAIHQPGLHPALVGFAQPFKRRGVEPELLRTVTEQERALACSHLGKTLAADADPIAMQSAVRFTKLLVQLYTLSPSTLSDHLYAAVLWYEALLLLLVLDVAGEVEQENLPTELLAELADCATLLGHRLPSSVNTPDNYDPAPRSPFAPESFTEDFYLTCYSQQDIAQRMFGTDAAMHFDHDKIRYQLARSVANRRVLLEQLRQQAAIAQGRNRTPPAPTEDGLGLSPHTTLTAHELALIGRLSLSIALYAACLGDAPEIALGYLDTLETLGFTLALSANTGAKEQTTHKHLVALVAELPTVLDYRLCAALQANRIDARRQAWADSPLDDEELILAVDFDLADTHVATVTHAAGPPPTAAIYVSHERAWVGKALTQLQRLGPAYAVFQKYAPVYTSKAGERLATYTHALTTQAETLYANYGKADELSAAIRTARKQARHGLQWLVQQGQSRYAQYIASGQATAFLAEQWRRCRDYIDAIGKRWK